MNWLSIFCLVFCLSCDQQGSDRQGSDQGVLGPLEKNKFEELLENYPSSGRIIEEASNILNSSLDSFSKEDVHQKLNKGVISPQNYLIWIDELWSGPEKEKILVLRIVRGIAAITKLKTISGLSGSKYYFVLYDAAEAVIELFEKTSANRNFVRHILQYVTVLINADERALNERLVARIKFEFKDLE